jgi:hypothetical protein
MNSRLWLGLACAATVVLQGCGTTYSQLVGNRYFTTNMDTHPVLISSVDGTSTLIVPAQVSPGVRRVTVQGPPGGAGNSELETFSLDVKPCMRYYIVAFKVSPLDSRFTPKVDFEQPLAGCRPPA